MVARRDKSSFTERMAEITAARWDNPVTGPSVLAK
jgi:hypothetical protein